MELKGIKQSELKKCANCNQGIMHAGSTTFYKMKIEQCVVDLKNVQSQHGLEQFFGGGQNGAILANVMGTDPDIAKIIIEKEIFLCMDCALEQQIIPVFLDDDSENNNE